MTEETEVIMSSSSQEAEMDCDSPARVGGGVQVEVDYHERVNPFEPCVLRNLKFTTWSPSVMKNVSITTPTSSSNGELINGWDVAQMAALFPKALEDSPSSHMNPYPVNSSDEARAQADIDEFFSRGPIAPTPDDVPKQKNFLFRDRKPDICHSWTNTELSFPVELPPEVELALLPYLQVDISSESQPVFVPEEEDSSNQSGSFRTDRKHMPARRKLELSFGELSNPTTPIGPKMMKYGDPFIDNHQLVSPGSRDFDCSAEFAARFERCFTPKSSTNGLRTPDLTPIRRN